jgi:hypothetical protein
MKNSVVFPTRKRKHEYCSARYAFKITLLLFIEQEKNVLLCSSLATWIHRCDWQRSFYTSTDICPARYKSNIVLPCDYIASVMFKLNILQIVVVTLMSHDVFLVLC